MKEKTTQAKGIAAALYARIQKKTDTLERIHHIDMQLSSLSARKAKIDHDLREARNIAAGFAASTRANDVLLRSEAEAKAEKLNGDLAGITGQVDQLNADRRHLKSIELPACVEETSLEEVIDHQERIKAVQSEAKRLEDAIAQQSEIIEKTLAGIEQVTDRSEQRAAILADLAIGNADQADLNAHDRLTNNEQKAHQVSSAKAEPIINQAKQTIAGLEAKLADLVNMQASLERKNPLILEQLLMTEIKRVSTRYLANALAVHEDFMKLAGLEDLLIAATGQNGTILPFDFTLPLPRLPENTQYVQKGTADLLFSTRAQNAHGMRANWRNSERQRLAGDGLEIL
jgi:hypothetical protein